MLFSRGKFLMYSNRLSYCLAACAVLVASTVARSADPADLLKDAGLTRSGDVYVLPDEAPVLEGIKSLRVTKVQADKESRARKALDLQIASKKKIIKDAEKEWHGLENRLGVITDVRIHNNLVARMNRLVLDQKQAMADEKDLEEQAEKASMTGKTKFVDDMATLAPKADTVSDKYKALAADAAVTSSIGKQKPSAPGAKVALGPSAEYVTAVADLTKWRSEVESEKIPLREEHGTHTVDVLLNGEHFLMGVDTGASSISLTGEVAEKLSLVPGPHDAVVHISLADGSVIEGHEMSIKTVRVGRFTLEDVPCVVLNKGLKDAPLLLGGSFLNHFVVKLDPAAGELQLTEIKSERPAGSSPTTSPARGAKPAVDLKN